MLLEVHDSEIGNTHVATVNNIDYDYMAKQWVQDGDFGVVVLGNPQAVG